MAKTHRLSFEGSLKEVSTILEGLHELICSTTEAKVDVVAGNKGTWKGKEAEKFWLDSHLRYLEKIKKSIRVEVIDD